MLAQGGVLALLRLLHLQPSASLCWLQELNCKVIELCAVLEDDLHNIYHSFLSTQVGICICINFEQVCHVLRASSIGAPCVLMLSQGFQLHFCCACCVASSWAQGCITWCHCLLAI